MGGVQRTAKFVKYLNKFGWEPIVITSSTKLYYAFDKDLLDELKQIKTYRTGETPTDLTQKKEIRFRNETLRKFFSKFAQIFLIPDTKIFWKKKAIKKAIDLIKQTNIDLIFTTAPPYTDFLVGYELSKMLNAPLVLDYRDDWIECPYNFYLTPLHKRLHLKLERKILNQAKTFITINNKIQSLIFQRYPDIQIKYSQVIPQGFDPEDFEKAKANTNKIISQKNRMRFCYAGSFLNLMTPEYFLKALRATFDKIPELKTKIEAYFIGIFPEEFIPLVNTLSLKDNITITGYLNHIECTAHLLASDVLWMMIGSSQKSFMISTGKLFEYIGTGKPILASIPSGTAKDTLSGYGAEFFTEPDNINQISDAIIHLFNLFQQGRLPTGKPEFIDKYNRIHLTERLADIFNKVLSE